MTNRQDEINRSVLSTLETVMRLSRAQSDLDNSITAALRSLVLQSDRYDTELAEIRDGLASLDYRLKLVEHGGESLAANVRPFRCNPDERGGA